MSPMLYVLQQLEPLAAVGAPLVRGILNFTAIMTAAAIVAMLVFDRWHSALRRSPRHVDKETPKAAHRNGLVRANAGHLRLVTAALIIAATGDAYAVTPGDASTAPPAGAFADTTDCSHLPKLSGEPVRANDNRTPAGVLTGNVLTVRLVVRPVAWYPDGPGGCGIDVLAFAEEDAEPSIPGPLIRVPAGTRVRVAIRNTQSAPINVKGLEDRPAGALGAVRVEPGTTTEVEFTASGAGSYFYSARFADGPERCCGTDGQLAGGLVIDPPGGSPEDRVFILTRWNPPGHMPASNLPDPDTTVRRYELNVMNGMSWPNTERLSYVTGDTARLRVINASGDLHIMHLHGFHYRLTSRGDNLRTEAFAPADAPLLVSEALLPEAAISIEWVPTRPGNWIFHCHLARHMSVAQRLDRVPGSAQHVHDDRAHAEHDMAGLIIGMSVLPAPDYVEPDDVPRRRLRLFANTRARVFGEHDGLGFVLQEDEREPAPDSVRLPGSTLLLRKDEPTEIVVHNRIGRPLSVHWHGLELDSYFDGVAGWSGVAGRIAPPIAPGDSFAVRITPPRAGTFIYHVHHGAPRDLAAGLYGAFIVLDPDAPLQLPATDRLFVVSREPGDDHVARVTGALAPGPVVLRAGERYRFRFIGIMPGEADIIELRDPANLVGWDVIARDGVDGNRLTFPVAGVAAGTTLDFSLDAKQPGMVTLMLLTVDAFGDVVNTVAIPVHIN
jgi:manganese oxidase